MIEVKNLTKAYSDFIAVADISFSIEKGQVVGFLGPNGAGKTTTLRMLTTYIAPSFGTAKVGDFDLRKDIFEIKKIIGYLPEQSRLYPELTPIEYLKFIAKIKNVEPKKIKSQLDKVISIVDIKDTLYKPCKFLSKGYKQRVGLGAALINDPKILFLDEPTSGLDPTQIIGIRNLIKDLSSSTTIFLSTHVLSEVVEACDYAIIISKGKIVEQGVISDLIKEKSLEEKFLEAISRQH